MRLFVSSCLFLALCAAVTFPAGSYAQDKTPKVAIINIQRAIAQSNEGQEAGKALRDKFAPKQADLEKQQKEISDLQTQLRNQDKTLSDDAKAKLMRTVDEKTRILQRNNEDATAEAQQAEQDVINEIGRKLLAVMNAHAQANGYTIVLDVSSPQTPVLFADPAIEITDKIIELYNATTAKAGSSSAPKPAAATAPPKAAPPKPAAP